MAIFKKKVKKSYGSIMSTFTETIADLQGVMADETASVEKMVEDRKEMDRKIDNSNDEIGNCSTAIDNITTMFPNLKTS